MAPKVPKAAPFRGPCGNCEHADACKPFSELEQYLFQRREFQRPKPLSEIDVSLDGIVQSFVASLRRLRKDGRLAEGATGNALSALVDYCITGVYANGLITNEAQFAQRAVRCGQNRIVFPYTWMCPLCVSAHASPIDCYLPLSTRERKNGAVRDYPQVAWLAKPGGRAIGDQGIQVVKALLREVLKGYGDKVKLRDGGGARGEFDLTIATDETLAFIEVKAKPLVSYPLVGDLSVNLHAQSNQHEWISARMEDVSTLSLFLGASGDSLPLSKPTSTNVNIWPLEDLSVLARDKDIVEMIVDNWIAQATAYEEQWGNEPDNLRWHRFGCGNFHVTEPDGTRVEKRVANTKELPGLDRTDDIKKGAAQVLKYSRLKFLCKKGALKAVLLGNTHALTHHEDYVEPILHLKVLNAEEQSCRAEWIFDAMVGLTRNHFNAPVLAEIFSFEELIEASD